VKLTVVVWPDATVVVCVDGACFAALATQA